MSGLFELLLPEDASFWWQDEESLSKKTGSVSSTDEESFDDYETPKIAIEDVHDHRGALSAIEMSFQEASNEHVVTVSEVKQDGKQRKKSKPRQQKQKKDTKSNKSSKLSKKLFGRLPTRPKGSKAKSSKKKKASKTYLDEEYSSDFSSATDQSSTTFQAPNAPLRSLAVEQQEALEKEMDQLISEALFGFDNKVIEKELDDQHSNVSIADYVVADVQVAGGLLAALVDRLDTGIFGPCGGCDTTGRCGTTSRYRHADDDTDEHDLSLELESIQWSRGGDKKGMDDAKDSASMVELVDQYMNVAREIVLNDDDTITLLENGDDDTLCTLDDQASLVSVRTNFNTAFDRLKQRAARHGISDVDLLELIQRKQESRKVEGLTPTMVEI